MTREEMISQVIDRIKAGDTKILDKMADQIESVLAKPRVTVSRPQSVCYTIGDDGYINETGVDDDNSRIDFGADDWGYEVLTIPTLGPLITEPEYEVWLEDFGYEKLKEVSKITEVFIFKKKGWPDINLGLNPNPLEVLMDHFEAVLNLPLASDDELVDAQKKLIELVNFTNKFKIITSVHNE